MKKLISILLIFCLLSAASLFVAKQTLAAGSFYLSPASGSFGKGSTIRVGVGVNAGGDLVNAVQANISYPVDKLQFTGVSTSGSALSIFAEKYASGGVVRIAGGVSGQGFSGSKSIASINFKVLADSGSGSLSFTGGSAALSSSNNQSIASGGGGATFNFTNQPATNGDSKDSQAIKITEGNESTSEDSVPTTVGYKVQIKVVDRGGKPLSGAGVILYPGPKKQVTGDDGTAVFDNAVLGNQPVVVEYKGNSQIQQIEIKESDQVQTFDLTFAKSTLANYAKWLIVPLVFGLITVLAIGWIRFKKY